MSDHEKYHKKKHCRYPALDADYCWSYASHIDKGGNDEDMEREMCFDCEYYDNIWEDELPDEI